MAETDINSSAGGVAVPGLSARVYRDQGDLTLAFGEDSRFSQAVKEGQHVGRFDAETGTLRYGTDRAAERRLDEDLARHLTPDGARAAVARALAANTSDVDRDPYVEQLGARLHVESQSSAMRGLRQRSEQAATEFGSDGVVSVPREAARELAQLDARDARLLETPADVNEASAIVKENMLNPYYRSTFEKAAPELAAAIHARAEPAADNHAETSGLRSIESRAELGGATEHKADPQQWVRADLRDFAKLQEQWERVHAGVTMAENSRNEPAYKEALAKESPEMAARVQQLDAENDTLTAAKDDRKRDEYARFERERADTAQRWTPEEAALVAAANTKDLLAEQDVTERHYRGEDMAVNARNSPAYRAALEAQSPEVAKELVERPRESLGEAAAAMAVTAGGGAKRTVEASNSWQGYSAADDALDRAAAGLDPNANWPASAKVSYGTATAAEAASTAPTNLVASLQTATRPDAASDASARNVSNERSSSRDSQQAADAVGLNGIEPASERKRKTLDSEQAAERDSALRRANEPQQRPPDRQRVSSDNKVESDEVFTATTNDPKSVIPPEVERQYRREGSKYYELAKPEVVAFEDKGNKLETRSNSEQVAENLVAIAKARGWDEIKVSGAETFRRDAWLKAAAEGMHVKGYTPSEADKEALAKRSPNEGMRVEYEGKPFRGRETESSSENAKEAAAHLRARAFASGQQADAVKAHPELAGAYVATAAVDRKAEADGLTPEQRALVASRVRQNVVNAIERGNLPEAQLNERLEVRRERERHEEREVSR